MCCGLMSGLFQLVSCFWKQILKERQCTPILKEPMSCNKTANTETPKEIAITEKTLRRLYNLVALSKTFQKMYKVKICCNYFDATVRHWAKTLLEVDGSCRCKSQSYHKNLPKCWISLNNCNRIRNKVVFQKIFSWLTNGRSVMGSKGR